MGVDPLTCSIYALPRWPRDINYDCILCGAPEEAEHRSDCMLSPIYAELQETYKDDIDPMLWIDFALAGRQTVIKCSECGRKILAKNAIVVWQAHPGSVIIQSEYEIKSNIENIVRAVCPQHNRSGTVSYERLQYGGR